MAHHQQQLTQLKDSNILENYARGFALIESRKLTALRQESAEIRKWIRAVRDEREETWVH